jgi:glycosyltransferase involved in cell wall biosynthesis
MLDRTTEDAAHHHMSVLAWPAPAAGQMNPYISLVYSQFGRREIGVRPFRPLHFGRQDADVLHAHWPEAVLWGRLSRSFPFMTKLAAQHALQSMDGIHDNGGSVVWTVHNLAPHGMQPDQQAIWNEFFPAFRQRVDLLIGMTERSLALACEAYPELQSRPRVLIPHPHFRTAYPVPPDMAAARNKIGLLESSFVIGMLGSIRPSKGIPQAITAFRKTRIVNSALDMMEMLLVSGDCGSDTERQKIEEAIGNDTSVAFRDASLSPTDLVESFAAVDAVLINQQTTLNSGTLLLALSMNRPVIAPAGGSISELAAELGGRWIFTFNGELTAPKLRSLITQIKRTTRPRVAPLERFDPATVSRATATALYGARARRYVPGSQYQLSAALPEKLRAHGGGAIHRWYH